MNNKYHFNRKRQTWLVNMSSDYRAHLDDDRDAMRVCLDMMFTDRPEHLIDVLIPVLHQYALDYAMMHDLRSTHEFTQQLYKELCTEIRDYAHFLKIREEARHGKEEI